MNAQAEYIHRASGRRARAFSGLWAWLRQVTGDAAYENYLYANRRESRAGHLLSPSEFYLDALQRRYSTTTRCC